MCTQGTLLSVLIFGFGAVAPASAIAAADPGTQPIMQSAASVSQDRNERIPAQGPGTMAGASGVCVNSTAAKRNNRVYLNAVRPGPGENLPSEELKMPRVFDLARVPLDRTILHPLSPKMKSPTPENEAPQAVDPFASGQC